MADLIELAERCERGSGPDRELDFDVGLASGFWKLAEPAEDGTRLVTYTHPRYQTTWHGAIGACIPELTNSLDATVALLERVLPGFWWRGGTCFLSSEATVCPDHNCPTHGARLMAECPPSLAHWNEGIEVEIRPGSQSALVRALLAATLRALATKEPS